MLFRNEPLLLPPTTDIKALADGFKEYFHEKIERIMNTLKLKSNRTTSNIIETDFLTTERMDILTTPDMEHIIKTITSIALCRFLILFSNLIYDQRSDFLYNRTKKLSLKENIFWFYYRENRTFGHILNHIHDNKNM